LFYFITAVTCPQLNAPQNAAITGCTAPFKYGTTCQQSCQDGYFRNQGTFSRSCLSDGTWSGLDIACGTTGMCIVHDLRLCFNLLYIQAYQHSGTLINDTICYSSSISL